MKTSKDEKKLVAVLLAAKLGLVILTVLIRPMVIAGMKDVGQLHPKYDPLELLAEESDYPFVMAFGAHWDSLRYLQVVRGGYSDGELVAWPPGYPLLIWAFSSVGVWDVLAGIIISNMFHLICAVLMLRVAKLYLDSSRAWAAALLFVFFPPNLVFGTAAYSEPVFVAFTLLAWLDFEGGRLWRAGLWTFCSSLVRYTGLLLFVVFTLLVFFRRSGLRNLSGGLAAVNVFVVPVLVWMMIVAPSLNPEGLTPAQSQSKHFSFGVKYPLYTLRWFILYEHPFRIQNILLHLFFIVTLVGLFYFDKSLFCYAIVFFVFLTFVCFITIAPCLVEL